MKKKLNTYYVFIDDDNFYIDVYDDIEVATKAVKYMYPENNLGEIIVKSFLNDEFVKNKKKLSKQEKLERDRIANEYDKQFASRQYCKIEVYETTEKLNPNKIHIGYTHYEDVFITSSKTKFLEYYINDYPDPKDRLALKKFIMSNGDEEDYWEGLEMYFNIPITTKKKFKDEIYNLL